MPRTSAARKVELEAADLRCAIDYLSHQALKNGFPLVGHLLSVASHAVQEDHRMSGAAAGECSNANRA